MKKLKKVFAVLLTLAMVLGLSMTSFAETSKQTITVNGLVSGRNVTVSLARILKLNDAGNQWEFVSEDVKTKVGMSFDDMVSASAKNNAQNGKINEDLKALNVTGLSYDYKTTTTQNGTAVFSDVEPGLYAIQAVDSANEFIYSYMVAAVDYNDGVLQAATVKAKGQSNQPEKEIVNKTGDASVASNDNVQFKITVYYPTFAQNAVTPSMEIVDTVENAEIQYGTNYDGIVITPGYGLSVKDDSNTTKLKIGLTGTYDASKAGDKIEITYYVKVNANLSEDAEVTNKVVTTIPDKDGGSVSRQAIVELPTFTANVIKANNDANGKPAITTDSATFELYKVDDEKGTETVVSDGSTKKLVLVATKSTDITNTDATKRGIAQFTGLAKDEQYYIKETKAPEGFALETKIYPLENNINLGEAKKSTPKPDENGVITVTTSYPDATGGFTSVGMENGMKFVDTTLQSLPETGGIGTTIFTIGGCAIMVIAAALFFASRRKSAK